MRSKPLINENLLQKVTKVMPFHIRIKQNPHKPTQISKQLKNIQLSLPINKQLEVFIELLNQQLHKTQTNNRDFLQRMAKILLQVKKKCQPNDQQTLQVQQQQPEITPHVIRKSSSKQYSQNKMEFKQQPKFSQGNFFIEKPMTGQLKKHKLSKLKIDKQNNEPFITNSQIKIEKLISKLQETEKIASQYKEQIQRIKKEIQNLIETNQQLLQSKSYLDSELIITKDKIKCLIDQKNKSQSDFQEKVSDLQKKAGQSANQSKILRWRLQQRQKQIAALWQLQIN